MAVIAMTREMGAGSREVAQCVADQLGLTIILHELFSEGSVCRHA